MEKTSVDPLDFELQDPKPWLNVVEHNVIDYVIV